MYATGTTGSIKYLAVTNQHKILLASPRINYVKNKVYNYYCEICIQNYSKFRILQFKILINRTRTQSHVKIRHIL